MGIKETNNRGKEFGTIFKNESLVLLNTLETTRINPSNGKCFNINLTWWKEI